MRKSDKTAAVILATLTIVISWLTHLDYNIIASEGLTLSSIVLAVYVAAILGLINTNLFCQHKAKRNTTHSGGVSFWSTFDLRCKSPACGDFYRKAEGNPRRFPPQTPPSSRRTKDSAFVRRKELAADTHARSAF